MLPEALWASDSQPAPQSASQKRDRLVLSMLGHFGLSIYICMYYRRSEVAMLPSLAAQPMQHYNPERASYQARHGIVVDLEETIHSKSIAERKVLGSLTKL